MLKTNDKSDKKASKGLYGLDLHDFIQRESSNSMMELANEYGISIGDVMKLKKQLERN